MDDQDTIGAMQRKLSAMKTSRRAMSKRIVLLQQRLNRALEKEAQERSARRQRLAGAFRTGVGREREAAE